MITSRGRPFAHLQGSRHFGEDGHCRTLSVHSGGRRAGGKSLLATVLFHKGRPDPPSNPMNRNVILIHLITAARVYTRIYLREMPMAEVKCLLTGRRGGWAVPIYYTEYLHLPRASRQVFLFFVFFFLSWKGSYFMCRRNYIHQYIRKRSFKRSFLLLFSPYELLL